MMVKISTSEGYIVLDGPANSGVTVHIQRGIHNKHVLTVEKGPDDIFEVSLSIRELEELSEALKLFL